MKRDPKSLLSSIFLTSVTTAIAVVFLASGFQNNDNLCIVIGCLMVLLLAVSGLELIAEFVKKK